MSGLAELRSLSYDSEHAAELVELLREDHTCYSGRGTTAVNQMRGHVLERLADVADGIPEQALPFVLEELQTGSDPYLLAASARVLRLCVEPRPEFAVLLVEAIRRARYRDEIVRIGSESSGVVGHLLATLEYVGSHGAVVRDQVEELRAQLPRKYRGAVDQVLLAMGPDEASDCCSLSSLTLFRRRSGSERSSAAALSAVQFEDQDGQGLTFPEFLTGKASIVVFFYTRCDNPLKCSLSINQLGELQRQLEQRGLAGRVRTAAITYDPAFDIAPRLRAYGQQRGFRFGSDNRMLRAVEGAADLREQFELGVNYVGSVVNRHRIELFVLDASGRIAGVFERMRWDPTAVVDFAAEVLDERKPRAVNSGVLGACASVGLALLPKCPVCWAVYLSMLGITGVQVGWLSAFQPLLIGLMMLNVAIVGWRGWITRQFAPVCLMLAGAVAVLLWRSGHVADSLRNAGLMLTLAGSAWSVVAGRRLIERRSGRTA